MYEFFAKLPVIRAYLHSALPYHVGSVWENRLGLQVFRTASQYLQFMVRGRALRAGIDTNVDSIDQDGIVLIENFLDPQQFAEVRAEFDEAFRGIELRPYKGSVEAKLYRSQIALSESLHETPRIIEYFQRNDRLNSIASAVVRRKLSRVPDVHFDWYQSCNPTAADNDIENILHADLHTATVKMFFYLVDVDASNGAFIYAKGSHKLTLNRLRHEYELSIRQAKWRRGIPIDGSLLETRGAEARNVINPRFREKMRIEETQMCVRANTLVIANNMGFHRRGDFLSQRPRKAIQINYRYLERPLGKRVFSSFGG